MSVFPNATAAGARRPGQPRISLTIPTYNRAPFLAELLEYLLPQFQAVAPGEVELIISDNCSQDATPEVIAGFQQRGLPIEYVRNEANVGADGNFAQCYRLARGQYVWVMGDDDILLPGSLPALVSLLAQQDVDLVYLSSVAFSGKFDLNTLGETRDKLGRYAEFVTDGAYFVEKVNALLGLISVMLVNKNLLEATASPALETLNDTNLLQMGWLLPLIHKRMRILYLWQRLLAYRSFNTGGWGVCEVFGIRLNRIAKRYFAAEPRMAASLMNGVQRYWMFDSIMMLRSGLHDAMNSEDFAKDVRPVFSSNWRYWVFVWPVAELPLPLAKPVHKLLSFCNRVTRIAEGLRHHWLGRPRYMRP
ncbi:MAG: glycosyltransferase family 2 protein [Acidobacteriaceae bacterium]|nr:glycosyltransferase family 2 protein [Acidobacteriaceae bacterium]